MKRPELINQQKLAFISSVWILDAVKRTYLLRWPMETNGEREKERERESKERLDCLIDSSGKSLTSKVLGTQNIFSP